MTRDERERYADEIEREWGDREADFSRYYRRAHDDALRSPGGSARARAAASPGAARDSS